MKRLLHLLVLTSLSGCIGFEESYYDDFSPDWLVPVSSACSTPTYSAAPVVSEIMPVTYQTPARQAPAIQTREPDLNR